MNKCADTISRIQILLGSQQIFLTRCEFEKIKSITEEQLNDCRCAKSDWWAIVDLSGTKPGGHDE